MTAEEGEWQRRRLRQQEAARLLDGMFADRTHPDRVGLDAHEVFRRLRRHKDFLLSLTKEP